jgi:hypothetical protein
MERDQIAEYLDQLRSGLLTSRRRALLILDEADDHLRESAAAGVTAGLTEAEAQQAAITSFGSVRAVVRAHAAGRHGPAFAAVSAVILAAWKLVAVYLLADFGVWLAYRLLSVPVGRFVVIPVPSTATSVCIKWCNHIGAGQPVISYLYPIYPTSDVWLGAGAFGLALLAVFALIRFRQRRSGRVRPLPLGSYSPMPGAVIFFGIAAAIVCAWAHGTALLDLDVPLVAAVCSAVGYAIALGRALHRRPRPVVVPA